MAASNSLPPRIPRLSKHKATGLAVVRLNGKDVYCGPFGSTASKVKYDRVIAEWLQRGRQLPRWITGAAEPNAKSAATPAGNAVDGLVLSELMLSYKLHADEYYRNSPKELERITLAMRPLREMYGLLPINEFGPVALKAVRQKMLTMQRRTIAVRDEKGIKIGERVREYRLSRRTINQRIDTLKRMFRWGVENEMVPPNVWHGLQAVKGLMQGRSDAVEPRKVTPVSTSEVEAVLPYVSRQVRGMIEIQRLTGARPGEICVLRPIDIDRTGKVWIYRPAKHKNSHREKTREIPIGPRGQKVLRTFLNRAAEEFVFSPAEALAERYQMLREQRKSKVPPSQRSRKKRNPRKIAGSRYDVRSYRRAIHRACQKANIPPWHPHQLRHTAATVLRREYGIEAARVILGHSSVDTTAIYAERDRQCALEVMQAIG